MPHYFEMTLPNGSKRHCGTLRDVESILSIYPDAVYAKILLPPPQTVDVAHVSLAPDPELPTKDIVVNMDGGVGGSWKEVEYVEVGGQKLETQQRLQQSEAQPIDLKMTVDTEKYLEFVKGVTSPPSLDWPVLAARLSELEVNDVNTTQLLTAALGLTAESG